MPVVDPIERQIRQVRRRRNLYELQRGLFLLIATAAAGAAVLVVLALVAGPRLFAVVAWSLSAAVVVTAALLTRELARRWLAPERAAAWVDTRSHLGGRLVTLVALRRRDADGERFFMPLLAAQNVERMARWRPEQLVRRRTPRAALAAAVGAATALALAVWLAPGLRPRVPEILYSDAPIDGVESDTPADGMPDRVVVAPARERARPGGRDDGIPAGSGDGDDDSALARLSGELQDRIRRQLWGREWERVRDAMARADRARAAAGDARATGTRGAPGGGEPTEDDAEDWETTGTLAKRSGHRTSSFERGAGRADAASDADAAARGFGADEGTAAAAAGTGQPGPGAGNETDPNLFGPATGGEIDDSDTFELAIEAPVRSERPGRRRPAGTPPPASADAHPELARAAHGERPVRKMPVPAAYESIVREVFAHRDVAQDGRP